jgi:hypothetical protein
VFRSDIAELNGHFVELERSSQAVIGIGLDLALHYRSVIPGDFSFLEMLKVRTNKLSSDQFRPFETKKGRTQFQFRTRIFVENAYKLF